MPATTAGSMTSLLRRYNQAARLLHRHAVVKNASSSRYSSTKSTADELLGRTDAFVFDCDGVIWKGDHVVPGAAEAIARLRTMGKHILFMTNNSSKSRKGLQKKFHSLGLDVKSEEILSSSFAVAAYFQQNPLPAAKKVYVIGHEGIGEELDLFGVKHIGGPDHASKQADMSIFGKVHHDPDVGAVVVGIDRDINYYKIQYAQLCINENPGCRFIATNLDQVAHLTAAQKWAGNGAMVGAIKGCTGREPILVGKPAPLMVEYILERYGFERSRVCMVGDRLDTDILFGLHSGLQTALVLTGVTSREQALSEENDIRPHFVFDSVGDLIV